MSVEVGGRPVAPDVQPSGTPDPLTPAPRSLRNALRELALLLVLLTGYDAGRSAVAGRVSQAFVHAAELTQVEQWLHLPREQALQAAALTWPALVRAANAYYAGVHFPLTAAVLVWFYLRRPADYRWFRNALVGATVAGLFLLLALPVAPPRMLPQLGFVDTGLSFHQSVYGPADKGSVVNQFAAMPSLHVGWAVLVAVSLVLCLRGRLRWLWLLHPLATLLVVVVTANHYWLDAVVGSALVLLALLLSRHVEHRRTRSRTEHGDGGGGRAAAPGRPGCSPRRVPGCGRGRGARDGRRPDRSRSRAAERGCCPTRRTAPRPDRR